MGDTISFVRARMPATHATRRAPFVLPILSIAFIFILLALCSAATFAATDIRINAGGLTNFVDSLGNTWVPDAPYIVGANNRYANSTPITGTIEDTLYQSERYSTTAGNPLGYSIPVPNGTYNVTMHFAEIYSGAFASGKRVFSARLEGNTVLSNFDIFAAAGANTAVTRSYIVAVNDGALTVAFVHGIENPKLSAIEVHDATVAPPPPPPPASNFTLLVRAGGPLYIDTLGQSWVPDAPYLTTQGNANFIAAPIANTVDDPLYQYERWAPNATSGMTYAFPVPNGAYNVTLHFAEIYSGTFGVGKRVFSISLENAPVASNFDIFALAGANAALTRTYPVTVSDGSLALHLTHGIENPKLSAIEIRSTGSVAPPPPPPNNGTNGTNGTNSSMYTLRVHAGGPLYVDSLSRSWVPDTPYLTTQGNANFIASPITNTVDDPLYQYERWGPNSATGLGYSIPVPNGTYNVTMHFAEIYSGTFGVGKRIFSAALEGTPAFNNIDVFAAVGANAPYTLSTTVDVTDGNLNLLLTHGIENPKLSAIELQQLPSSGGAGHYSHAKAGDDKTVVDIDGNGSAAVVLDGITSHTHLVGFNLTTIEWRRNGAVIASGSLQPTVELPVGQHTITLFVADAISTSTDDVVITVASPTQINGLAGYYYSLATNAQGAMPDLTGVLADYAQLEPQLADAQTAGNFRGTPYSDNFVARYTGLVSVPSTKTYVFGTASDDGSLLYIDGNLVVNNSGVHAFQTKSGSVPLTAGLHSIQIDYVEKTGSAGLQLLWNETGTILPVPATALFHDHGALRPVVNSIDPIQGQPSGGNTVTLHGFGFVHAAAATTVTIGGVPLTGSSITVVDDRTIAFIAPVHSSGLVDVTVTTPNGVSKAKPYTYTAAALPPVLFNESMLRSVSPSPTTLAFGPDGRLYVGTYGGVIYIYTLDENHNIIATQTVNTIANMGTYHSTLEYCPGGCDIPRLILGIGFNPLDDPNNPRIYVTHSNIYNGGVNIFGGMVSILSGPGFTTRKDIITGLPTSGHDHGTFGIEFGMNGEMYVQSGGMTNAGVPHPIFASIQESPLSGATLLARIDQPGFNGNVTYSGSGLGITQTGGFGVSMYADGQRSAYDIILHSNGHLYATDNGPNGGYGNKSITCTTSGPDPYDQDELNLIEPGKYYGHPSRYHGQTDSQECVYHPSTDTVAVGRYQPPVGPMPSSVNGIDEYRADTFQGQLRGHLITSTFQPTQLIDIVLSPDGRGVTKTTIFGQDFGGLDVIVGPDGTIYTADITTDAVYRHVPIETLAPGEMRVTGVQPFRGPLNGNRTLTIFGSGFSTSGTTTVSMGGKTCSVTSVTTTRIKCAVPAGTTPGYVDVTVSSGSKVDALGTAYLYMNATQSFV